MPRLTAVPKGGSRPSFQLPPRTSSGMRQSSASPGAGQASRDSLVPAVPRAPYRDLGRGDRRGDDRRQRGRPRGEPQTEPEPEPPPAPPAGSTMLRSQPRGASGRRALPPPPTAADESRPGAPQSGRTHPGRRGGREREREKERKPEPPPPTSEARPRPAIYNERPPPAARSLARGGSVTAAVRHRRARAGRGVTGTGTGAVVSALPVRQLSRRGERQPRKKILVKETLVPLILQKTSSKYFSANTRARKSG